MLVRTRGQLSTSQVWPSKVKWTANLNLRIVLQRLTITEAAAAALASGGLMIASLHQADIGWEASNGERHYLAVDLSVDELIVVFGKEDAGPSISALYIDTVAHCGADYFRCRGNSCGGHQGPRWRRVDRCGLGHSKHACSATIIEMRKTESKK